MTSRVVVARWEQKHYLEERTGLHLLFLRALFRRRWHKNGNDLEYDFAGYVRVMKWRLLLGVLDRILTRVIESSMLTQRRILSRQARRKLKCLEPKLHLVSHVHAMYLPGITEILCARLAQAVLKPRAYFRGSFASMLIASPGVWLHSTSLKDVLNTFPSQLLTRTF